MDLTPEYQNMVRSATELATIIEKGAILLDDHTFWTEDNVWLPRQDQLQPLLTGRMQVLSIAFMKEKMICNIYPIRKLQEWKSYEQLWLCLTMLFLFEKCWDFDKTEWIPLPKKSNLILAN